MAVTYKDRDYPVKRSPTCYPCLPRCQRHEIEYCCDRPPSASRMPCCEDDRDYPKEFSYRGPSRQRSPSCHRYSHRSPPPRVRCCPSTPPECCSPPPECCSPPPRCCHSPPPRCCYSPPPECCTPPECRSYKSCCQPVRTKYVIPCYRYEDGRIDNQPTVLMRRACEVAVGVRPRKKPFVHSSYSANDDLELRQFHSEDEMGNCCYHFEAKNKGFPKDPANVDYGPCVPSTVADPSGCCVYY